jgi:hypothetical protein
VYTTAAEVEAYFAAEISPGTGRPEIENWVEEGKAAGQFSPIETPNPALVQLLFSSMELAPILGDSGFCKRLRFMAVLMFSDEKYQGCSVLDVSNRVPAGDDRHYFGSDDEIASFMEERFSIGMALEEARSQAEKLAPLLPDLETEESESVLELQWSGAFAERGFMTAQGVQQGYQPLSCRACLRFEGAKLKSVEYSAFLQP